MSNLTRDEFMRRFDAALKARALLLTVRGDAIVMTDGQGALAAYPFDRANEHDLGHMMLALCRQHGATVAGL